MNTQNLEDNYPKLNDHIVRAGYCATYIIKVRREIDYVLSGAVQTGHWFVWRRETAQGPALSKQRVGLCSTSSGSSEKVFFSEWLLVSK